MKLSIITPTYNSEKYIDDTLESIKNQTYKNIEHIIMDNLSTDNTKEICMKYKNSFFSQKDRSMYDAINNGILKSTGSVLSFINSDDMYPENTTVEKVINFFKENKEIDVVYGNCKMVDKDLKYLYLHTPTKELNFKYAIDRIFVIVHQSIFIKKDVFTKHGLYDLNLKNMADCEYWIRLLKEKVKFKYYNETLSMFRRHDSNLSSTTTRGFKEVKYIREKYGYKFNWHNDIVRKGKLLKDNLNNFNYLNYLLKRWFSV